MDSYCLQQSVSEVFNNQLCVRFTRRLMLHEGMSHLQCHRLQMGLPVLWQPRVARPRLCRRNCRRCTLPPPTLHFKSKHTVGVRPTAALCLNTRNAKKDVMLSYVAVEDNGSLAHGVIIWSMKSCTSSAYLKRSDGFSELKLLCFHEPWSMIAKEKHFRPFKRWRKEEWTKKNFR